MSIFVKTCPGAKVGCVDVPVDKGSCAADDMLC